MTTRFFADKPHSKFLSPPTLKRLISGGMFLSIKDHLWLLCWFFVRHNYNWRLFLPGIWWHAVTGQGWPACCALVDTFAVIVLFLLCWPAQYIPPWQVNLTPDHCHLLLAACIFTVQARNSALEWGWEWPGNEAVRCDCNCLVVFSNHAAQWTECVVACSTSNDWVLASHS